MTRQYELRKKVQKYRQSLYNRPLTTQDYQNLQKEQTRHLFPNFLSHMTSFLPRVIPTIYSSSSAKAPDSAPIGTNLADSSESQSSPRMSKDRRSTFDLFNHRISTLLENQKKLKEKQKKLEVQRIFAGHQNPTDMSPFEEKDPLFKENTSSTQAHATPGSLVPPPKTPTNSPEARGKVMVKRGSPESYGESMPSHLRKKSSSLVIPPIVKDPAKESVKESAKTVTFTGTTTRGYNLRSRKS